MDCKVAVCIPTYNSEDFIARTLACARNQTYKNIEIIVSVDLSDDNTLQIISRQAREDPRIKIIENAERLGWSQNANRTLDAATGEYYFLYFHDDLIDPEYVEILLATLMENTDAASAHCDLLEFGILDEVKPAHGYFGNALDRLVEFMMTRKGTTLRSLVRRSAFKSALRFPQIPGDNHWTAYVFHMHLLAAGPALAVPRILYKRWQRQGSLTRSKGWQNKDLDALLAGQEKSIMSVLKVIDRYVHDEEERKVAKYCLKLFQYTFIRKNQLRLGNRTDINSRLDRMLKIGPGNLRFEVLRKDLVPLIVQAEKNLSEIEIELKKISSAGC